MVESDKECLVEWTLEGERKLKIFKRVAIDGYYSRKSVERMTVRNEWTEMSIWVATR